MAEACTWRPKGQRGIHTALYDLVSDNFAIYDVLVASLWIRHEGVDDQCLDFRVSARNHRILLFSKTDSYSRT
jgi:hypothetical protein